MLIVLLGLFTGFTTDPYLFWLYSIWLIWLGSMVWAVTRPEAPVSFLALQVVMMLFVIWPGTLDYAHNSAVLYGTDFTKGIPGALRMVAIAEAGLVLGTMLCRSRRPEHQVTRLRVQLPGKSSRRLIVLLFGAGVVGLVLFVVTSGGQFSQLNVFSSNTVYGSFKATATGPTIQYFSTALELVGVATMLVVLRFNGGSARRPLFVLAVLAVGIALLGMGGQRQQLVIPILGCGLIWWKTARTRLARRTRTLMLLCGAAIFVVSGVLVAFRTPAAGEKPKSFGDVFSAVSGQTGNSNDLFVTTAGLAQNVPAKYDYLAGSSYLAIVALPIPRALWKSKPIGSMVELQNHFFDSKAGSSFPEYGEMYANFGLFGVALGCFGLGYLLEAMWLRFAETESLPSAFLLAVFTPVILLVFLRNYAAAQLAGQFGILVGAVIAANSIRRWGRRRLATATPAAPATPESLAAAPA